MELVATRASLHHAAADEPLDEEHLWCVASAPPYLLSGTDS